MPKKSVFLLLTLIVLSASLVSAGLWDDFVDFITGKAVGGTNTLIFDDFNDGVIDEAKWSVIKYGSVSPPPVEITEYKITETIGHLQVSSWAIPQWGIAIIQSKMLVSGDVKLDVSVAYESSINKNSRIGFYTTYEDLDFALWKLDDKVIIVKDKFGNTLYDTGSSSIMGNWTLKKEGEVFSAYKNGNLLGSWTLPGTANKQYYVTIGGGGGGSGGVTQRFDWVLVTEPTKVTCADNDYDGYQDINCGGDDCDDSVYGINPGAVERCDVWDNNCDGRINEGCYLEFDYNNDNVVDGADALFLVNITVGISGCPTGKDCDLNDDGRIIINDVILLQRIVTGLNVCLKDSDVTEEYSDGKNYYLAGSVEAYRNHARIPVGEDFCLRPPWVAEYFCENATDMRHTSYECPNGCQNGACVAETVLPTPPSIMAVDDDAPASDTILIVDIGVALKNKGYNISYTVNLFSEVNALELDNKVTLAVYNGEAVIIVGEHSPAYHVTFANDVAYVVNAKGVIYRKILSNEITSSNLRDLFVIKTAECTDTDGGMNYYVKGRVTGWNHNKTERIAVDDYCSKEDLGPESYSGPYVVEGICSEDDRATGIYYKCPDGCQDGACDAEVEEECSGYKCDESGYYIQKCYNGEWFNAQYCPNGCKDGACLSDFSYSPANPTDVDEITFTLKVGSETECLEQVKVWVDEEYLGRCLVGQPSQGSCSYAGNARSGVCSCKGGPYKIGTHAYNVLTIDTDKCGSMTESITEPFNVYSSRLLCPDGTPYNACASTKPRYCAEGIIVDNCQECGCYNGYRCRDDGTCQSITIPITGECNGCMIKEVDACVNFGLKANINGVVSYCDIDKEFKPLKEENEQCLNSFECLSDYCVNRVCVDIEKELKESVSILWKIWCKITNPFSGDDYLECLSEHNEVEGTPAGPGARGGGGGGGVGREEVPSWIEALTGVEG